MNSAGKYTVASPQADKTVAPTLEVEDSDEEDVADGDLSALKPGFMEPCKLVCFVIRNVQLINLSVIGLGSPDRPQNDGRQNRCSVRTSYTYAITHISEYVNRCGYVYLCTLTMQKVHCPSGMPHLPAIKRS